MSDEILLGPEVFGPHEFAAVIGLTMRRFNVLRNTDPAFPISTRLKIGPVWSPAAVAGYDLGRRRMGVMPGEG